MNPTANPGNLIAVNSPAWPCPRCGKRERFVSVHEFALRLDCCGHVDPLPPIHRSSHERGKCKECGDA